MSRAKLDTSFIDRVPPAQLIPLLEAFAREARKDLNSVIASLKHGQYDKARCSAHRLCGGAQSMGAQLLAAKARETETALHGGAKPDTRALRQSLQAALDSLEAYRTHRLKPDFKT